MVCFFPVFFIQFVHTYVSLKLKRSHGVHHLTLIDDGLQLISWSDNHY